MGTFGKTASERKVAQTDRFPISELPDTVKNIKNSYRASDDPTNYRYDNIAHVAEMPTGEKRVVYTRLNTVGKEEIINWHKISEKSPNFIETLKSFGVPDRTRTGIKGLERPSPVQLNDRDIINVAESQKPVKLEGKPSKVAESIEARAIEKKLTDDFKNLAEFEPTTVKAQAKRVAELIDTNLEKANAMAKGEEPLPADISGSMLIKGLEEYGLKNGDVQLLKDLAQSPLVAETSVHAQELRLLAERHPNSPVEAINQVVRAREQRATRQLKGKSPSVAVKEMANEIRGEIKKTRPTKQTWSEFIDSIQC